MDEQKWCIHTMEHGSPIEQYKVMAYYNINESWNESWKHARWKEHQRQYIVGNAHTRQIYRGIK